MNREEIDLLESVFTLAIGECAYNDINNIQKLEDKIKTINNLCKKQKEVIDKTTDIINDYLKEDYSIYTENEIEVDLIVKLKNILKEASK